MISYRKHISLVLFAFLWLSYAYFFHGGQANENARFNHIRALVEDGTNTINAYSRNTHDVVRVEGKTYSNKPPGLVFASALQWWVSRKILSLFNIPPELNLTISAHLTNIFSVNLASALLGVILFNLCYLLSRNYTTSIWIALAYGLGTTAFPYSVIFYSHQFAAFLLFSCFTFLYLCKVSKSREAVRNIVIFGIQCNRNFLIVLAGFLGAYSVICEYNAAFPLFIICLYSLHSLRTFKSLCYFALGGILGVAPLFIFNLIVFNDFLFVTYGVKGSANTHFHYHKQGFLGMTSPHWKAFKRAVYAPPKGLLYCCPWLALSVFGLFVSFCKKKHRIEYVTAAGVAAITIFFHSALVFHGGSGFGPRYLLPCLPFLALLVLPFLSLIAGRILFALTVLPSVALMFMVSAIEPRVSMAYQSPVGDFYWYNFIRSNLHDFDHGINGIFSDTLLTFNSVSFNIGDLLPLSETTRLLPLLAFWGITYLYLFRKQRKSLYNFTLPGMLLVFLAVTPVWYRYTHPLQEGSYGLDVTCTPLVDFNRLSNNKFWNNISQDQISFEGKTNVLHYNPKRGLPYPCKGPFSMQLSGKLWVEKAGRYRFYVRSGHSIIIYINGERVLLKDKATYIPKSVKLSSGMHDIDIRINIEHERGSLRVLWQGEKTNAHIIPAKHLFLP